MAFNNDMDINPEKMTEVAASIIVTGKKYQSKVDEIFANLKEMNTYWTGQEYDAVVAKFNSIKPTLDDLGTLVNKSIPEDINTAVSNYTNAQNKVRNMFS